MSSSFNLLDSLIENNSILIRQNVNNWQEAIELSLKPLVKSGAIEKRYIQNVIASTINHGPYYIISNNVAMPHARPEDGAIKNAFSLVTLNKPIRFQNDLREISILIALAAKDNEIHVGLSLPQVVAVFESDHTTKQIMEATSTHEIINIIKKVNLKKYL